MANTKPIPSNEELKAAHQEAQERLRIVRADVFDGRADADDLAKAEADVAFARTRIDAAAEARNRRRSEQAKSRAPEIVEELKALHPVMDAQKERAEKIRALIMEYTDAQRELHGEIHGAYIELMGIRDDDRSKTILKENGITVTRASMFVRVGSTAYTAPPIGNLLGDMEREATQHRRKQPVAQRPPRQKRKAA